MEYDWRARAACRNEETAEFWARRNEPFAARICASCTVPNTCLQYAISNNLPFGIWGGHRFYKGKRRQLGNGSTRDGRVTIEVD